MRVHLERPTILPRRDWTPTAGAGSQYPGPLPLAYHTGTIHHDAAVAAPNEPRAESLRRIASHYQAHTKLNGWADIGYHYLITPLGEIVEGRPLDRVGAHVGGANTGNVGICLLGNFERHQPTDQQIRAAALLWAWLCQTLELQSADLKGHRDFNSTACPGTALYRRLDEIRTTARRHLLGAEKSATNRLTVDGEDVGELIVVDGQAYAPVRVLAEALGGDVRWDPAAKSVEVVRRER